MMRKRILTVAIAVLCCLAASLSVAADDTQVVVDGKALEFSRPPVTIDDRLMVPIRNVVEAMNCDVDWDASTQTVTISDEKTCLELKIDHVDMQITRGGSVKTEQLDVAPLLIDDTTYLPLRKVAEALGGQVVWEEDSRAIFVYCPVEAPVKVSNYNPDGHTFFFQNEARFNLPNSGSGYCWVCSYAMVLSDTMGREITPVDVANVNLQYCGEGECCYHAQIVDTFGAKFVPAVDPSSRYYRDYEPYFGATFLNLPDEQSAVNALKEALDRNPSGILVRFEAVSPHTIVAIGYEGDNIIFNETIPSGGAYSDTSIYQNISFSQTFPGGYCGLGLKDLTSIQAIAAQ